LVLVGILKDAFHWLVNLTEASVAIAVVLLIGLAGGLAVFWLVARVFRKLSGPPEEEEDASEEAPDEHSTSSEIPN
jgi:NhaP-type Na+/H+ or K+/H+ antiporter